MRGVHYRNRTGKARENMNSEITLAKCPICGKFYPADKIHKCRKRLEVDCRKCENCTVKSCVIYGGNAEIAVSSCAKDGFKNYHMKSEGEHE